MNTLYRWILAAAAALAALLFVGSAVAVLSLAAALWGARALWLKLTGRPVAPLAWRFSKFPLRPGAQGRSAGAPRADVEVVDVEAKRIT